MLIQKLNDLQSYLKAHSPTAHRYPKKVLMVKPDYFKIEYSINPYMTDDSGNLKKIDHTKAIEQWQILKNTYEKIGLEVLTLEGDPELPDMVFAANQSFPFVDPQTQKPSVLLSSMRSPFRKKEVSHFKKLYQKLGYPIFELDDKSLSLEGNGDLLIQPGQNLLWGAYGPRTDKQDYEEIANRFQLDVVTFELICKDFYHLDTCFSILNHETVAIQKEAFSRETLEMIRMGFKNVIEIEYEENFQSFAGNCHSVNGRVVILQIGTKKFKKDLEDSGFILHEVDTSEFMKSGGSVFCMKMMVY